VSVAIVTGAASGIGRATAIHLARAGRCVALVDIDSPGLRRTRDQIEVTGGEAIEFHADVSGTHELGVVVREVLTTMGSPELLVNVAQIGLAATVLDTSDEDWTRVIRTNLTGPFLLTRAVLPLMLDRGSGVIINVASVAGAVGLRARAAYCASKAAPGRSDTRSRRRPCRRRHSVRGRLSGRSRDRMGRRDGRGKRRAGREPRTTRGA
jgi:NAD(P)-dependent dehydrogenase (short-subunit alcohol dehydrogenase family)